MEGGPASAMNPGRQQGRVKWFDAQKGWGFIQPLDGSDDIFVHQQSILAQGFRSLDDGEDVEFETETDNQGRRRAVNVSGPGGMPVRGSSRPMGFRGNNGGGNFANRENRGQGNRGGYQAPSQQQQGYGGYGNPSYGNPSAGYSQPRRQEGGYGGYPPQRNF